MKQRKANSKLICGTANIQRIIEQMRAIVRLSGQLTEIVDLPHSPFGDESTDDAGMKVEAAMHDLAKILINHICDQEWNPEHYIEGRRHR